MRRRLVGLGRQRHKESGQQHEGMHNGGQRSHRFAGDLVGPVEESHQDVAQTDADGVEKGGTQQGKGHRQLGSRNIHRGNGAVETDPKVDSETVGKYFILVIIVVGGR